MTLKEFAKMEMKCRQLKNSLSTALAICHESNTPRISLRMAQAEDMVELLDTVGEYFDFVMDKGAPEYGSD